MSDRKAVNKYYPPDWRPEHGSINKYHGTHPLRDRARKLKSEGVLIIRFETPWNMWCLGCDNHIGKGVRYNAQKKKAGKYFTTTIWSFRMKCHLCDQWFEIQNDPENTDFKIISGCRRKVETWQAGEEAGTIALKDEDEKKRLEDPMYNLEHKEADKKKAIDSRHVLTRLQEQRDARGRDDYSASRSLRAKFRKEKKSLARKAITDRQNIAKRPLLPSSAEDEAIVKRTKFTTPVVRGTARVQRAMTRGAPILRGQSSATTTRMIPPHQRSSRSAPLSHSQSAALLEKAKRLGIRVQANPVDEQIRAASEPRSGRTSHVKVRTGKRGDERG